VCGPVAAGWAAWHGRRGTESRHVRGYGRTWEKRRKWILDASPTCALCGSPANEVDHILPKAQGGTDDDDNLQALCPACHQRKTLAESRQGKAEQVRVFYGLKLCAEAEHGES
jgi:5-methylcytosine-specific restriction endonuclease McrA